MESWIPTSYSASRTRLLAGTYLHSGMAGSWESIGDMSKSSRFHYGLSLTQLYWEFPYQRELELGLVIGP